MKGRIAPYNGSVTRDDIRAIYREFARVPVDPPPTAEEFCNYLVGAIEDRPITDLSRRRMAIARANFHSRRRSGELPVLAPVQRV